MKTKGNDEKTHRLELSEKVLLFSLIELNVIFTRFHENHLFQYHKKKLTIYDFTGSFSGSFLHILLFGSKNDDPQQKPNQKRTLCTQFDTRLILSS